MAAIALVLLVVADAGPAVRAAYGIGTRLDTLALFAGMGWGACCTALVGQNLAVRKIPEARDVINTSVILNIVMMSAAGAVYWIFPESLVRLFALSTKEEASMGATIEAVRYLRIGVFSYPGLAVCVVVAHALNGAGSVKTPLLIDAVGLLLVQIPAVWIAHRTWGIEAAWWALVASHSAIALVYYVVYRAGAWERKRLN
jgi:Na+-driven multidrug efflux pump